MTFIDTNVIIDVFQGDPVWADWSLDRLEDATAATPATINAVVIAELSPNFETLAELETKLESVALVVAPLEADAAFMAGRAYARYRRDRPETAPIRVLPDFMIGAHALMLGLPLLTRDPVFYRRYFPELELITPQTDNG